MKSKDLYYDFLLKEFPIKRIKENKKKWQRVIIVDSGLIRDETKIYKWKNGLDLSLAASDLIVTLKNVFGCSHKDAYSIVEKFFDKFSI